MDRRGSVRAVLGAIGVAAVLSTSACGTESESPADTMAQESTSQSPSPSESGGSPGEKPSPTAPPGTPACADVWQEGATLPRSYSGCVDGDTYHQRSAIGCSSGQRLIRYDDRFYSVPGGTVQQARPSLAKDKAYRKDLAACTA
jgi:hypothetical protein